MGAQHRHADAGDADRDPLILEDLSGLLDDLGLLVVVAGCGIDGGVVVEEIEGVGVWQHLLLVAASLETARVDSTSSSMAAAPAPLAA